MKKSKWKKIISLTKLISLIVMLVLSSSTFASDRPNILWIFADDLSALTLESYGNKQTSTPTINSLASDGVLFSQAFANNPICSPSRSSVITGMYPSTINAHNHRSHLSEKAPYRDGRTLPAPVNHIAHYFREAGYQTHNIGDKEDYNFNYSGKLWDGDSWDQVSKDKPFFAIAAISKKSSGFEPLSPNDVNIPPYYADHAIVREDLARTLNSITNEIDPSVESILRVLEEKGFAENTIVFFFSDHGKNGFRAKQWLYDGGIQVPLIVRWPARPDIVKPGKVVDEVVSLVDLAVTSLSLAGIEPPEHLEGKIILGPAAQVNDYIVASRDRGDETFHRIRAIRTKNFKYIRNYYPEIPYSQTNQYKDTNILYRHYQTMKDLHAEGRLNSTQSLFFAPTKPKEELYDLVTDKWEVNNLANDPKYAAILTMMRANLKEWMEVRHESLGWRDKGAVPEKATRLFLIEQENNNSQIINIITTADDPDSRLCSLKVEYSLDDGKKWFSAALSENLSAEYGHPVVDNKRDFQISDITTSNIGANTIRFQWDTQSEQNGSGPLERKLYENVRFRVTQTNGMEVRKPVLGTHGFYRDYPAVLEDNAPFIFDFRTE